ncbi:glyoxylase-like metal-dependent hydrolase (beta-lactamase superfamily II) [Arthrobacter ginsengisoli]|uniref:Glyoxylase-like metal-dependent hydrolase (Beta-lactamase superfamily II) n=1 Tax=Arthrobacter ginsengisoli TaxID=1356565 RepID=A0ABU1UHZ9_9MICC|nr:MBL fold metallo-hydrolase [Arthrobacter ginsengisoli]MDR7084826.1 glyoxylase-like metal-dependent hydrolase (beta-lactamase superfamily II) [Arthrobacter ginsengisoli]
MTLELAPGLWSIPVRIPIPSLKTVNVYLLELEGGGAALIDTGWDDEASYETLLKGVRTTGHELEDIATVVITHAHPDHLGLAHRIRELSGATVLMHEAEAARLRHGPNGPQRYADAMLEALPRWGVDASELDNWLGSSAASSSRSWEVPVSPVRHGQVLDLPGWNVEAVWTPGHTHGHLCLFERTTRSFFSGDHVLPRITPVIGMHPGEETDPLADFLASLHLVATLDVSTVMPAHERPFVGLAERVAELKDHHAQRLGEVHALVEKQPGITAWKLANLLTWSRPLNDASPPTRRLALAETQAHLVHLQRRGELVRSGSSAERWRTS